MALSAAIAVHGAAVTVAVRTAPREPRAQSAEELTDIGLLEEEQAIAVAPNMPAAIGASGAASAAGGAAPGAHPGAAATAPVASGQAPSVDEVIALDRGAPSADVWSFRPTTADIGLDARGRPSTTGTLSAMAAAEASTPNGPAQASVTGGLVEGLHARDQELGLGRGGPVRSAVESVVQAGNTMGVATFEVRIGGSGAVSVRMVDASNDANAWSKLADAISAEVALHRDKIRLPPNVHGLRVTVRAEAKDRLPDGHGTPKGNSVSASPGSIKETKDRIEIVPPTVALTHDGKVCRGSLVLGLHGAAVVGGCSPENIGATMVRIVAAQIVSESFL
jgi:hypothetical protein